VLQETGPELSSVDYLAYEAQRNFANSEVRAILELASHLFSVLSALFRVSMNRWNMGSRSSVRTAPHRRGCATVYLWPGHSPSSARTPSECRVGGRSRSKARIPASGDKPIVRVVGDQRGTPTFALDLPRRQPIGRCGPQIYGTETIAGQAGDVAVGHHFRHAVGGHGIERANLINHFLAGPAHNYCNEHRTGVSHSWIPASGATRAAIQMDGRPLRSASTSQKLSTLSRYDHYHPLSATRLDHILAVESGPFVP
jgi:hypothetical protein